MIHDDNRELILTLRYPLPLECIPELAAGVAVAVQEAGFVNVSIAANGDVFGTFEPAMTRFKLIPSGVGQPSGVDQSSDLGSGDDYRT